MMKQFDFRLSITGFVPSEGLMADCTINGTISADESTPAELLLPTLTGIALQNSRIDEATMEITSYGIAPAAA